MKIAISSTGASLNDSIDERFGRCRYFVIVDPENLEFDSVENPGHRAMNGAGPLAVRIVMNMGVNVVVTGKLGPNAHEALKAAGIKVLTGASGRVRDGINQLDQSSLQEAQGPTVSKHDGRE